MIVNDLTRLIKAHKRFPVFGIILFTSEHAHVVKMLKDEDYWNALDEISGDHIAVLYTAFAKGRYEFPPSMPGTMSMLVPIWKEPNKNKELLSLFSLEDSKDLPFLIFFAPDADNRYLYYKKYPIKAESPNATLNVVQEILSKVSNTVLKNTELDKDALFRKVEWTIMQVQGHFILDLDNEFLGIQLS